MDAKKRDRIIAKFEEYENWAHTITDRNAVVDLPELLEREEPESHEGVLVLLRARDDYGYVLSDDGGAHRELAYELWWIFSDQED